MATNIVVLMNDWGTNEMTDAERAALAEILNAGDYRLPDDDCWGGGGDLDVEWTVRATQRGEAEGDYYRRAGGDLQILGYSIERPEGLGRAIDEALDKLGYQIDAANREKEVAP